MSFLAAVASDASPVALGAIGARPALEWSAAWVQFMIDSQRSPLQAMLAWQMSAQAIQRKNWSDWMGRVAGGTATDS
jgi:hypothetical protein